MGETATLPAATPCLNRVAVGIEVRDDSLSTAVRLSHECHPMLELLGDARVRVAVACPLRVNHARVAQSVVTRHRLVVGCHHPVKRIGVVTAEQVKAPMIVRKPVSSGRTGYLSYFNNRLRVNLVLKKEKEGQSRLARCSGGDQLAIHRSAPNLLHAGVEVVRDNIVPHTFERAAYIHLLERELLLGPAAAVPYPDVEDPHKRYGYDSPVPADVAIVICTWDGDDRDLTRRVITAAAEQGPVVVIDMSPHHDLREWAHDQPAVRLEHVPASRGLGESRQIGMDLTGTRFVAFVDSDAMPRKDWLAALMRAVAPDDVAVAGGRLLPVWPSRRRPPLFRTAVAGDFLSMFDLGDEPLVVPRVLPSNMIVDRSLTGPGVFDVNAGRNRGALFGAEEIDMMRRVVAAGWRIVYEPGAIVDHRTASARMSWRWMWRRAYAAGQEARAHGERLAPLPRRLGLADRLFQAVIAPAYVVGAVRARPMRPDEG
jgi:GT2 family glycosyltransferase